MKEIIEAQKAWSLATFGPGRRTAGIIQHIKKELAEIEADPGDITEWADMFILAIDGAWRAGWGTEDIVNLVSEYNARITWEAVDRFLVYANDGHPMAAFPLLAACALDLAEQHGHTREALLDAVREKQRINREERTWPDWRGCGEDDAIEHIK